MSSPVPASRAPASFVANAGTTAGSYRLERRLGAGGMGEVWLGRHVVSQGTGAVKLLGPKVSRRADAVALFAREQSILLRLSHPHIVPVFEVSERHIAMAYIDGPSLGRRLRSGIAPSEVFRMARQIASALAHAHARGVLHLDVKPSNILTDSTGNAYLADFGAAWLLDEAPGVDPVVFGTPSYIAPERASSGVLGTAGDQFALGRTIVAALLGTERLPAWSRESEALPASIPEAARRIIERSIAVDPADRFPSLEAFEDALATCDLEGLTAHVGRLDSARSEEAYSWASRPSATEAMVPEIVRADYDLEVLERDGALAPAPLATFRAQTGLRTTGFSLYGHTRSLGHEVGASWLARARHLVLLAPGYLMARECWSELAVALVRDNPDTIVATLDHSGFGDSRFVQSPPALEHMTFAGIARTLLAWTDLFAVASFPTVILGHSLAATGLVLLPDEAFGAHRARILLTPMFSRVFPNARAGILAAIGVRALSLLLRVPGAYWATFTAWTGLGHKAKVFTPARRRAMTEQALQLPLATHIRLGEATTCAVPSRVEPLRRTYFALGVNDPETRADDCDRACRLLGIRPERLRWLASGGHCPHIESLSNPEGTLRNRHELVQLVDEALDEVSPARRGSTEFAETELSTDPENRTNARPDAPTVRDATK
jgi:serine/threonine protein kinase